MRTSAFVAALLLAESNAKLTPEQVGQIFEGVFIGAL
jgi:hypothetical protein